MLSLPPSLSIPRSVGGNLMPILLPDLCLWNTFWASVNQCFQLTGPGRAVWSQCRTPWGGGRERKEGRILLESCHNLCSVWGPRGSEESGPILEGTLHEQRPKDSRRVLSDPQHITDKHNLPVYSLLLKNTLLFLIKERKREMREGERKGKTEVRARVCF